MANRGDSNRLETPRQIRRMLALMDFKDAHHRGVVKRLFQQATEHALSVDRHILSGHGYHDPQAAAEEAITTAATEAVHIRNDLEAIRLRKKNPLKED